MTAQVTLFLGLLTVMRVSCCDQQSMSQSGEENAIISTFFKDMKGGTYVEMGALDGVTISNTLFLHKCLGWNGVLLEASPVNYKQLAINSKNIRPNAQIFHGAVCVPPHHFVNFYVNPNAAVSGDTAQMSEGFMRGWIGHKPSESETVKVPCKPMSYYLTNHSVINFWSLDIEGAELIALETTNFRTVHFDVIMIEMDGHDGRKNYLIRQLLFNANFVECVNVVKRSGVFLNRKPSNPNWKCPHEENSVPSYAEVKL